MEYLHSTDTVYIADGAVVCGDVTLADGVSVWFHAVIRGDKGPIVIGKNTNIQDGAVLHEATVLGEYCTVGHRAVVHGCTVGDRCLIGMGSILLTGAVIGNDCIIAAGALVTGKSRIPDGMMVMGSPAKAVRPLTEEELRGLKEPAEHYVQLTWDYR